MTVVHLAGVVVAPHCSYLVRPLGMVVSPLAVVVPQQATAATGAMAATA